MNIEDLILGMADMVVELRATRHENEVLKKRIAFLDAQNEARLGFEGAEEKYAEIMQLEASDIVVNT